MKLFTNTLTNYKQRKKTYIYILQLSKNQTEPMLLKPSLYTQKNINTYSDEK